ncbi:NAD(P)-binding protein [Lentinus tigrinus ALCF2SS1-7]|uniref:NAD(P)-binding protein n=1 Tax=Lentinus tigrinus ALCF2SS1-6 TaxID=1328759 RepID=A0A5C2RX22_9APHY|nr:NAD(P)-binding protein [Lentinus tigrinus ALCF2SS1-6]RPD72608.1 NAD(P)-binding protein [Lentinus tigrinus ALCF2SS1-7]
MSISLPALILVTGASGFLASHIVTQLLDDGYRVRGTARGGKIDLLREHFKSNQNFEAVKIDDIATSDFSAALKGVDAVIHAASPLVGKAAPVEQIQSAVEGTLNVLRQAVAAGVYKVVVTSSWATLLDPDNKDVFTGVTFTEKSYGKADREDLINGNHHPLYTYLGSKILAEEADWKFAEEHPELDLATINPPFLYGKFLLHPGNGPSSLGSNSMLYQLIAGKSGRPLPPQISPEYCHVTDAARAHILALKLPKIPPGADVRDKRFIVAAPEVTIYSEVVKYVAENYPELKDRLPTLEDAPALPGPLSKSDPTRAREVLGIKEYIGLKETLDETIKSLLEVEKSWS